MRDALEAYSESVRHTRRDPAHHPEASLYSHLNQLLRKSAQALGQEVQVVEQYTQREIGAPDFAVRTRSGALSFVEAKSPDTDLSRLRGRDQEQFERYMRLGNIVYTNYWQIDLYQRGQLAARAALVPAEALDPQTRAVDSILAAHDIADAVRLLEQFLAFEIPHIGTVEHLAQELARAAWLVREAVAEAMRAGAEDSPLRQIFREFRDVLFYELDEAEFADAYAQTLAYGLLLARQATGTELTTDSIVSHIDGRYHQLLSATLRLLSQPQVVEMVGWTIENLLGVVNHVSRLVLLAPAGDRDPLLYFYEDFLAIYDPELRKQRGVYYTPRQVVNLQTRVISHLLTQRFGRRYGFADQSVHTLDPAAGTGTYLVSALNEGSRRIEEAMGAGSVPDAVSDMAMRLHGFEILVGPYTVAHFRVSAAIEERGGQPGEGLPILLCDTLLPPHEEPEVPTQFGFMSAALTEERRAADDVKRDVPIMVILGNPPYRRGRAEPGWLWDTLLPAFRDPVPDEYRIDLKNLADLYVWFYRWALWKLFESESAPRQGVLSFISNSRWILGGAFGGMRQVMRRLFDRVYIIDLHGDTRAPLPAGVVEDENIFEPVQVGVAISVCIADGSAGGDEAEVLYYGGTWGSRDAKYQWLDRVRADLSDVSFEAVEGSATDPFFPGLSDAFSSWPSLKDDVFLFSWSGVQTKRDHLVVAPTRAKLRTQIDSFANAPTHAKPDLFHDTGARTWTLVGDHRFDAQFAIPYGYRPLDTQWLYNQERFLDRRRPALQAVWGLDNIAFTTLPSGQGAGPAVFLQNHLPDICSFRGSYTSRVFPLWDNRQVREEQESFVAERDPNITGTVIEHLAQTWGQLPTAQDLFSYCYAVLSAPSYALQFATDLARSYPRVPLPRTAELYSEGVRLGKLLVDLHTFRRRYPADGSLHIQGSPASIQFANYDQDRGKVDISRDAWVGPVTVEAWAYSVSGYQVLRQWLLRRRDAPFDLSLREQLLDVIWAVERTVELSPDLDHLLERVLQGGTMSRAELGLGAA
jgi:hypothetical protein